MNEIVEKKEVLLTPLLKDKKIAWFLLIITLCLTVIENFLKMTYLIGGWHIIGYILFLMPLLYLSFTKRLINTNIKWFFIPLFIMIIDMFIYNNDLVQYTVPVVFYMLTTILYFSSMHHTNALYQTIIPNTIKKNKALTYLKLFFENLFISEEDKKIYMRIGMALLITVPFLILFVALLFSADREYENFLSSFFSFKAYFDTNYIFTIPFVFFLFIIIFTLGLSNEQNRRIKKETKALDMLIVGIFLSMINLLFLSFILFQMPFLLQGVISSTVNIASFAREGFFQLMTVIGLIVLIFLFIMKRHKGEKLATFLLIGLLGQTIIMGIVSLKKMYLYQSIKGATSLRYYVEWFDYLLLIILFIGILFLIKKLSFAKLLNIITVLGTLSFSLVISINIDNLVASHNINKFKNNLTLLDKSAIRYSSIDALPAVKENHIDLSYTSPKGIIYPYKYWYKKSKRKACSTFSTYHYGYCSLLKKYGEK